MTLPSNCFNLRPALLTGVVVGADLVLPCFHKNKRFFPNSQYYLDCTKSYPGIVNYLSLYYADTGIYSLAHSSYLIKPKRSKIMFNSECRLR